MLVVVFQHQQDKCFAAGHHSQQLFQVLCCPGTSWPPPLMWVVWLWHIHWYLAPLADKVSSSFNVGKSFLVLLLCFLFVYRQSKTGPVSAMLKTSWTILTSTYTRMPTSCQPSCLLFGVQNGKDCVLECPHMGLASSPPPFRRLPNLVCTYFLFGLGVFAIVGMVLLSCWLLVCCLLAFFHFFIKLTASTTWGRLYGSHGPTRHEQAIAGSNQRRTHATTKKTCQESNAGTGAWGF